MLELKFLVLSRIPLEMKAATARAARPVVRMAALQLVPEPRKASAVGIIGIARYSSSLRLALHPRGHTAHAVQLRFLG